MVGDEMTEGRIAELRAMFDDMAGMANVRYADPRRGYQATDKVTVDFLLQGMATMCSALVEIMDVVRTDRANLELLEAHSENLIERVYVLEGGDPEPERRPRGKR